MLKSSANKQHSESADHHRASSSLARRETVYTKMFHNVACSMTNLSWKLHENPFTRFYPVHGANLTLIQPMWSAYPYAPTSLYGIHMPLLSYMVIQPIVLGMALLWAAIDSALSQGPLLWRHNDMTVIVSRNSRGRVRDTRQRLNNANARRLQTVNR